MQIPLYSFVRIAFLGGGLLLSPTSSFANEEPETLDPFIWRNNGLGGELPQLQVDEGRLYGMPQSLVELPRSLTLIPESLLLDFRVQTLEDLTVFSPGTFAAGQFGHVTTPVIRGDVAESYVNGQRRSNNLFGYKPILNSVDQVGILRGPASATFGPGFHTGGYINFQTKRPDYFVNRKRVTLQLGSWLPDSSSYMNSSIQADVSGVIQEGKQAFRISYEGRINETQYDADAAKDNSHSIYGSWGYRFDGGTEVEVMGEYLWQQAPQLLGVNRPSQDLVDHGSYVRGAGGFAGPAFVVLPPVEGEAEVELPLGATVLSDGDEDEAQVGWIQMNWRGELGSNWLWENQTLFEGVDRQRVHEFEYFEYVEQVSIENRTVLRIEADSDPGTLFFQGGVALRYEERTSYVNFFNEYPVVFDLSNGPGNFSVRDLYPSLIVPGIPGPDGLEFFGLPFSPETTDSELWNAAGFIESSYRGESGWEVIGGLRLDHYSADARDPITPNGSSDSLSTQAVSGNVSLLYHTDKAGSFFVSYNDSNSVEGSIAGGGIMLNATGLVNEDNFENRSRLLEAGWRWASEEGDWFYSFSLYQQDRKRMEIRGAASDLQVRGVEFEAVFQPSERLSGFMNVTWMDGSYKDSAPSQLGGRSLFDLYALGHGPGGEGTGAGYDFFFLNQVPAGDYRIPGLPDFLAKAGLRYQLDDHWGLGFWGDYASKQSGNLDEEYWIPSQFTLNANLSYRWQHWEASVQVLNLTNEVNWIHNGQTFFNNQLIGRALPRRVEGTVRISF